MKISPNNMASHRWTHEFVEKISKLACISRTLDRISRASAHRPRYYIPAQSAAYRHLDHQQAGPLGTRLVSKLFRRNSRGVACPISRPQLSQIPEGLLYRIVLQRSNWPESRGLQKQLLLRNLSRAARRHSYPLSDKPASSQGIAVSSTSTSWPRRRSISVVDRADGQSFRDHRQRLWIRL